MRVIAASAPAPHRRPRVAFLGLGWIGIGRMRALCEAGAVEVAALADPSPAALDAARALAPEAARCAGIDDVLALRPDGLLIATPSALHAEQAIAALAAGVSVFCQKPVGRTAAEAASIVDAARKADRLLAADLSYRHAAAFIALVEASRAETFGRPYAADLTFHNAYGPDKPWFRQPELAGGGCLIDLGVHLVDLALRLFPDAKLRCVSARLHRAGGLFRPGSDHVEDHAVATLEGAAGEVVRLACSWNLPAGCDAIIAVDLHGTSQGVSLRNENGSFYHFSTDLHEGTRSTRIQSPPDAWGGRAALDWARRLAAGGRYDADCENLVTIAGCIDAIYAAASTPPARARPAAERATA